MIVLECFPIGKGKAALRARKNKRIMPQKKSPSLTTEVTRGEKNRPAESAWWRAFSLNPTQNPRPNHAIFATCTLSYDLPTLSIRISDCPEMHARKGGRPCC